jgi:hypothetical protein
MCSQLDGNKNGVIDKGDTYGVYVNWKTYLGARPDLLVKSITLSTPPAEVGYPEQVQVVIRNNRSVNLSVFDSSKYPLQKLYVWFDEDPYMDANDTRDFANCMASNSSPPCWRMRLIQRNTGAWLGNGESTVNFTWTPQKQGSTRLYALVGTFPHPAGQYAYENDEGNNLRNASFTVSVRKPDLSADSIKVLGNASLYYTVPVLVNVSNLFNVPFPNSTQRIYVRLKDGAAIIREVNISKTPGSVWYGLGRNSYFINWSPSTYGTRTLTLEVDDDPDQNGIEASESNNKLTKSFYVDAPDLVIENVSISSSSPIGQNLPDVGFPANITVTVRNNGSAFPLVSQAFGMTVRVGLEQYNATDGSDPRYIGEADVPVGPGTAWDANGISAITIPWTPTYGQARYLWGDSYLGWRNLNVSVNDNLAGTLEKSEANNAMMQGFELWYSGTCEPVMLNGDPNEKADVVFLAVNVTRDKFYNRSINYTSFALDVNATIIGMQMVDPFNQSLSKFNIHKFNIIDSYCGDPENPNCGSANVNWALMNNVYYSCPSVDQRAVFYPIFQHGTLGGYAYPSYNWLLMNVYSDDSRDNSSDGNILGVFLHEFGHSFGDLQDEYPYYWINNSNNAAWPNCAPDIPTAMSWWGPNSTGEFGTGDLTGQGRGYVKILNESEQYFWESSNLTYDPFNCTLDFEYCLYGDEGCQNYTQLLINRTIIYGGCSWPPGASTTPSFASMMSGASGGMYNYFYANDASWLWFCNSDYPGPQTPYLLTRGYGAVNERALNVMLSNYQ